LRDTTRTTYSGSAPGADSNTYVMFSTVVAAPMAGWHQLAGIKYARIDIKHNQSFTLNAYKSPDRGVTWHQVSTEAITVTSNAVTSRGFDIQLYRDFKIEVVNGGSAQGTWAVDIGFRDKLPKSSSATFAQVLAIFSGGSLFTSEKYTGTTTASELIDWLDGTHKLTASVAQPVGASSALAGQKAVSIATGATYTSNRGVSSWKYLNDGITGMTVIYAFGCQGISASSHNILNTVAAAGAAGFMMRSVFGWPAGIMRGVSANIINYTASTFPKNVVGTGVVREFHFHGTISPNHQARRGNTLLSSGDKTGPVTNGNPDNTLIVGSATADPTDFAFLAFAKRILTDAERSTVYSYVSAKYGIAL
jgi:hypothetical protein